MITRLRRRHRWLAPLSFALAIAVFAAAMSQRPTSFAMRHGGAALRPLPGGLVAVAPEGAGILTTIPGEDVVGPDLAYYGAGEPAADGTLPGDAVFLGRVMPGQPTSFDLDDVRGLEGAPRYVLVHSLGWDRVVASAPVGSRFPKIEGLRSGGGR